MYETEHFFDDQIFENLVQGVNSNADPALQAFFSENRSHHFPFSEKCVILSGR